MWICSDPSGHIQATGRDARGRKQYRYHPRWREVRDETKFGRMLAFSEVLPAVRAKVDSDLARPGLPREKVLAAVVRLLECTGIRVGNDEYAKANRSFGLTTLRDQHVEVSGSTLRFQFRGKSGKSHDVELSDRRLARIVQRCQALPGEDLFQYVDDEGNRQTIGSGDVNDYLRQASGQDFTAKDFRTWAGTILALAALRELGPTEDEREAKSIVLKAIDRVAEQLNNTRAVCRKYYVHPAVFETYAAGSLLESLANGNGAGRGRRDCQKKSRRWSACSSRRAEHAAGLVGAPPAVAATASHTTPTASASAAAAGRGDVHHPAHHRCAVNGAEIAVRPRRRKRALERSRRLVAGARRSVVEDDVVHRRAAGPGPGYRRARRGRERLGVEEVVPDGDVTGRGGIGLVRATIAGTGQESQGGGRQKGQGAHSLRRVRGRIVNA